MRGFGGLRPFGRSPLDRVRDASRAGSVRCGEISRCLDESVGEWIGQHIRSEGAKTQARYHIAPLQREWKNLGFLMCRILTPWSSSGYAGWGPIHRPKPMLTGNPVW